MQPSITHFQGKNRFGKRHSRVFCHLLFVGVFGVATGSFGQAFDWQSVASGNYTSVTMTSGGNSVNVSVLNAINPIVNVANPNVSLLGTLSGSGFNSSVAFGNNRGLLWDFTTALSSVTFLFGDGGGDNDGTVSIAAFDAANNLLGTGTKFYGTSASGDSLTLLFPNMDHFQCTSDGVDAPNSLFFEVSASTTVPEPTTLAMFSLGAAVLLRRRYK